jgi:hypothetical protein
MAIAPHSFCSISMHRLTCIIKVDNLEQNGLTARKDICQQYLELGLIEYISTVMNPTNRHMFILIEKISQANFGYNLLPWHATSVLALKNFVILKKLS